jgi:hypothetical protein
MSDHAILSQADPPAGAPGEDVPLCTRCLAPHSQYDYYCPKCGAAVGQFTAYIPFVDIPFYANFYARLWERVWYERDVAIHNRVASLLFILWLAPVMLAGVPFALLKRRGSPPHQTA